VSVRTLSGGKTGFEEQSNVNDSWNVAGSASRQTRARPKRGGGLEIGREIRR
jgi:hypothetical protein